MSHQNKESKQFQIGLDDFVTIELLDDNSRRGPLSRNPDTCEVLISRPTNVKGVFSVQATRKMSRPKAEELYERMVAKYIKRERSFRSKVQAALK